MEDKKQKQINLQKQKKVIMQKKKINEDKNINDNEKIEKEVMKEIKENAIETVEKFKFFKEGYLISLGTLAITGLSFLFSAYFLIYSNFIYKAPNTYLPINEQEQLLDDTPLSQPVYTDNEIRQFATDALNKLTDYNFVTLDTTYFSDIRDLFIKSGFTNYKKDFEESAEIKMVKENYFVVRSNIVTDARLPKRENMELRKKSRKYVWSVELNSNRIYQNREGFTYDTYKTRIIIVRTPRSENKRGIAIHSIINEKMNK